MCRLELKLPADSDAALTTKLEDVVCLPRALHLLRGSEENSVHNRYSECI